MKIERINGVTKGIANIDGEDVIGDFRIVDIPQFPDNVKRLRLYARAWGHKNGDPGSGPSNFIEQLISGANNFLDSVFPFTTKAKDRPGFRDGPQPFAYMDIWVNGIAVPPSELRPYCRAPFDTQFDNYNLYFDDEDWKIPKAGDHFQLLVAHGNSIADVDGFEVFAAMTFD